jgi:hypothetical protein
MQRYLTWRNHNEFGEKFLNDVLDHISDEFKPDDVFDEDVLRAWAEANGFIHQDDLEADDA